MGRTLAAFLVIFLSAQIVSAEELKQIFTRVEEFVTAKNYTKALEELSWAKNEIEKMNTNQLKSFLPDQLGGFTGEKFEANNMLGITNLERTYRRASDKATVKVSLTGTSKSGGGAFGNLAALGSMAAMMGGASDGQETMRIAGNTASLEMNPDNKSGELTVFLSNSGAIVKLDMNRGADAETLKNMAQAINLSELDKYLKGVS